MYDKITDIQMENWHRVFGVECIFREKARLFLENRLKLWKNFDNVQAMKVHYRQSNNNLTIVKE